MGRRATIHSQVTHSARLWGWSDCGAPAPARPDAAEGEFGKWPAPIRIAGEGESPNCGACARNHRRGAQMAGLSGMDRV